MRKPLKRPNKSGKGCFCTSGICGIQTEHMQPANV